mgnify:CR=1 FL=1|tara:strand:- start:2281 stop:2562 length:282 start_codon:yes stop_codon:yes gene_type:complete
MTQSKSTPAKRKPPNKPAPTPPPASPKPPTKLATVIELVSRAQGASLAELQAATGWQAHSVRGALAGALRKKGHVITSTVEDGVRRYRIETPA